MLPYPPVPQVPTPDAQAYMRDKEARAKAELYGSMNLSSRLGDVGANGEGGGVSANNFAPSALPSRQPSESAGEAQSQLPG
jgi:hypothetical protein